MKENVKIKLSIKYFKIGVKYSILTSLVVAYDILAMPFVYNFENKRFFCVSLQQCFRFLEYLTVKLIIVDG